MFLCLRLQVAMSETLAVTPLKCQSEVSETALLTASPAVTTAKQETRVMAEDVAVAEEEVVDEVVDEDIQLWLSLPLSIQGGRRRKTLPHQP